MSSKRRREQRQKVQRGENKEWMRARLAQSNMELTRPSGTGYKRKPKYAGKWEEE